MMEGGDRKSLPKLTALLVSVLFHPLFMPLYGLFVIFNAPTLFWYIPVRAKLVLLLIFVVNNLLLPLLLMGLLRLRGVVSSWTMENREERTLPLLGVVILYIVTSVILSRLAIPVFFRAYGYSLTALSVVLLAINTKWKVSLHAAGAGALVSTVLILSVRMAVPLPFYLATAVMISGIVLSSRLRLNAHNQGETYGGFIAGLLTIPLIMVLFH